MRVSDRLGGLEASDGKEKGSAVCARTVQWSQELQAGGRDYERAVWRGVRAVVGFSVQCAQGVRASLLQVSDISYPYRSMHVLLL